MAPPVSKKPPVSGAAARAPFGRRLKEVVRRIPAVGGAAVRLHRAIKFRFPGSRRYWENRYAHGGDSGVGSCGKFAEFKAEVLNGFVREHGVESVIELGCGDGNQLKLSRYPKYVGLDVSLTAIARCKAIFASDPSKSFKLLEEYSGERADLALSLDVIYHLVEDEVFERHMRALFESSERYVIVYSSDFDENTAYHGTHVRHRKFTAWVEENIRGWRLVRHIPNRHPHRGDYRDGSFADFFVYEKERL